jgi:LPS sulfotransferase NodH
MPSKNANRHAPQRGTARFHIRRWRHRAKLAYRWWLWPHAHYQPFFILATYRSGSNLLVDYLRKFQGVDCHGEVLLTTDTIGLYPSECSPAVARRHIRQSLQSLRQPVRGCKLMLDQFDQCGLSVEDLRNMYPGAKYLILYREAIAEQFVSHQLAHATGQWRSTKEQTPQELKVPVDAQQLIAYCQRVRQSYASLFDRAWLRDCSAVMSYEQLVADPHGVFARQIWPLLGIDGGQPQTDLKKQNTLPLAERIANYSQIKDVIDSPVCRQLHQWPKAPSKAA